MEGLPAMRAGKLCARQGTNNTRKKTRPIDLIEYNKINALENMGEYGGIWEYGNMQDVRIKIQTPCMYKCTMDDH